jgi:hypothetical protein
MSAHANPDIIDDGLVFLYDTDDGKSYKGEPTTNLITNSGTSNTGWVGYGWTGSQAISNDYPNTYEFTATNGWHNRTFDTGVTSGGTIYVTFQYKLKQQQTTQNQLFVLNGTHLGSYTNWLGSGSMSFEWQTFSGSFTANANSSKIAIGPRGQDSSGLTDIVYIRNLQVEQKPHSTPFVNGTRSATQGLLDRTGNETINLSDVSFNSNSEMIFDGTDDFIPLVDNPQNGENSVSWEFITKFDLVHDNETSTYRQLYIQESSVWIGQYYDYIGIDIAKDNGSWFDGNGGRVTSSKIGPVNSGEYYHVVFTWDGTNVKGYLNSELGFTTAISGLTGIRNGVTPRRIGRRSGNPLIGEMPIVKLYNRALTATEVLQNFNATKSRFGL